VDYSYYLVNQETVQLSPKEAMQFGKTLSQILYKIVNTDPQHGPVYMIKVDVPDGFYCIHVAPHHIPAFPPAPDGTPLVVFPLVLPMGWVESPPYFCMATETIADIANHNIKQNIPATLHWLCDVANTSPKK
jgi:hypothetical protein